MKNDDPKPTLDGDKIKKKFKGRIFLQNDWNTGDEDNQNVAAELDSNRRIGRNVTVLSRFPESSDRFFNEKVPKGTVTDAKVVARATRQGDVAIAMGGMSSQMLEWLDAIKQEGGKLKNITIVSHSDYNESNGQVEEDDHGEQVNYPDWLKIRSMVGTTIEIPRADAYAYGKNGGYNKEDGAGKLPGAKDISDLGMIHYLKTGESRPLTRLGPRSRPSEGDLAASLNDDVARLMNGMASFGSDREGGGAPSLDQAARLAQQTPVLAAGDLTG